MVWSTPIKILHNSTYTPGNSRQLWWIIIRTSDAPLLHQKSFSPASVSLCRWPPKGFNGKRATRSTRCLRTPSVQPRDTKGIWNLPPREGHAETKDLQREVFFPKRKRQHGHWSHKFHKAAMSPNLCCLDFTKICFEDQKSGQRDWFWMILEPLQRYRPRKQDFVVVIGHLQHVQTVQPIHPGMWNHKSKCRMPCSRKACNDFCWILLSTRAFFWSYDISMTPAVLRWDAAKSLKVTVLLCDNRLGIQVLQVGKSSEEVFHFVSHPLLLLWCLSVWCESFCNVMSLKNDTRVASHTKRNLSCSCLLHEKSAFLILSSISASLRHAQVQVPSPRDPPPDRAPDATAPPNPRSSALASRRRRRGP